jgi:rod shape-determining protein MreD
MNTNSSIETRSAGFEQAIPDSYAGAGGGISERIAGAAYAPPNSGLFHVKQATGLPPCRAQLGNCRVRRLRGILTARKLYTRRRGRLRHGPTVGSSAEDRTPVMQLVIAAAVAVVAALSEFTIVPYLRIGDAVLHPVLVFGVVWAIAGGLEAGLAWAFVGGLALDILGQRPLGSSAFSLLIAIGIASVIGGLLGRVKIIAPIVATAIASPVYLMLLIVTTTALTSASLTAAALDPAIPSAVYDTVLAVVVGPLVLAIVLRRQATERVDW